MATHNPPNFRDLATITLLMGIVLATFVSQVPAVIVVGTLMCGLYAYAARSNTGPSWEQCVVFMVVSLLFLPAFGKPHHGLSPVFYFISTVLAFFAAQAAARKPPLVLLNAFRWIYGASLAVIAWILYTYWEFPEPFGMFIEGSSTNGIPAYLIVIQIGLSLSTYATHGRLPVVTPFLTGAVAFFGVGRGSLVVAGLIILSTLVFNLCVGSRRHYGFAGLVVAAIALVLYGAELFDWIVRNTKLGVGLVDVNRIEIWHQYWNKLDGFTILFGADYANTVIAEEHKGNPHIAYIRTHSFFGLPLTVIALLSPTITLFAQKSPSAKLVFFTFIGLAALRAYSEPLFFPTLLDFFYFSYFLIFFNHLPNRGAHLAARKGSAPC